MLNSVNLQCQFYYMMRDHLNSVYRSLHTQDLFPELRKCWLLKSIFQGTSPQGDYLSPCVISFYPADISPKAPACFVISPQSLYNLFVMTLLDFDNLAWIKTDKKYYPPLPVCP